MSLDSLQLMYLNELKIVQCCINDKDNKMCCTVVISDKILAALSARSI